MRGRQALLPALLVTLGCHGDPPAPADGGPSLRKTPPRADQRYDRAKGYDPSWQSPRPGKAPSGPTAAGSSATASPKPVAAQPSAAHASPRPHASGSSNSDPMGGRFSLGRATRTLPAGDRLVASIETTLGTLSCQLWPKRAPNTVANFVGLANGTRPWRAHGGWSARPAYDGSLFHRVSPTLGIRGGREGSVPPRAPGYFIADERWEGMRHDKAGLLCAVGAGKDRVGMEFLITTGPTPQLDQTGARAAFTVFGSCEPAEVIGRIAASPAANGRPSKPVRIKRLRVGR